MAGNKNRTQHPSSRIKLMGVIDQTHHMGMKFHINVRDRMSSAKKFPQVEHEQWQTVRNAVELGYKWYPK